MSMSDSINVRQIYVYGGRSIGRGSKNKFTFDVIIRFKQWNHCRIKQCHK